MYIYIWLQFVDTLFIVRLRPNILMCCVIIINYYFLVHKMEVENLMLLSTQVLRNVWGMRNVSLIELMQICEAK